MTRPLIPPRGIFITSSILYHPEMNAAVKETLIQVIGLAWGNKGGATPPLSYPILEQLTRKSERRLYGHFTILRTKFSALELQDAGNGSFVIKLADWLFVSPGEYNFKQAPVKEEESVNVDSRIPLPPHDSVKEEECEEKPRLVTKFCNRKPLRKPLRTLSPELHRRILDAGVYASLLDEIARSSYSEEELHALLDWCTDDRPASPAPLLIARIRHGARIPPAYCQPPCRHCGQRGGSHAADCRGRYLAGEYADYLEM